VLLGNTRVSCTVVKFSSPFMDKGRFLVSTGGRPMRSFGAFAGLSRTFNGQLHILRGARRPTFEVRVPTS